MIAVAAPAGVAPSAAEGAARSTSAHTTDGRTARDVVFYRLGQKFVDHERSIPEDVRSVLYYTLAIGHHTGVIDCLTPRLSTSREVFAGVLAAIEEGPARDKLAGIEKFGEIEVKKEHIPTLKPAVLAALQNSPSEDIAAWLGEFLTMLEEIQCEPQVYAMGRRVS